jgi:hypothetical protein
LDSADDKDILTDILATLPTRRKAKGLVFPKAQVVGATYRELNTAASIEGSAAVNATPRMPGGN